MGKRVKPLAHVFIAIVAAAMLLIGIGMRDALGQADAPPPPSTPARPDVVVVTRDEVLQLIATHDRTVLELIAALAEIASLKAKLACA
jgi:hypothetical protein